MVTNVSEEAAASMFAVYVSECGKMCIGMGRDVESQPISSLLSVCSKMLAT